MAKGPSGKVSAKATPTMAQNSLTSFFKPQTAPEKPQSPQKKKAVPKNTSQKNG